MVLRFLRSKVNSYKAVVCCMLNQRLLGSIWLLDAIRQLKVPVWCNRSSGGSVTGGSVNSARRLY